MKPNCFSPGRRVKLTDGQVAHLEQMSAARFGIEGHSGRAPFLSAVSAAVDDFSMMEPAHLRQAIDYAEQVHFLLPRARKTLGLLRKEEAFRRRKAGQSIAGTARRRGV